MRRLGIIAFIAALTLLMITAVSFAGSLEIEESYPSDGATGIMPINVAIKVWFDQDVFKGEAIGISNEYFRVTDEEGEEQEITVVHDPGNRNMVLIVMNNDLADNTEYTLTISDRFTSERGDSLGNPVSIRFTTQDMGNVFRTSMIMMFGMFIVILIFSSRQTKKDAQKEEEAKDKKRKVNPYKVSKRTGKSVDEIVKKTEKEKQKRAEEEAKHGKRKPSKGKKVKRLDYVEEEPESANIRVRGPSPIADGGSDYKSGKRAKAEKEAAKKKASGTTRPKNQSAKKRNKKR